MRILLASLWLLGLAAAGEVPFQRIDFREVEAANGIYSLDINGDGTPDLVTFGYGRVTIRMGQKGQRPMYPDEPEVLLTGSDAYFATFADVLPAKGKELLLMTPAGVSCCVQEQGAYVARAKSLLKCETLLTAKPVLAALAAQGGGNVTLLPLNFAFDVNGDGRDDILVPTFNGLEVYLQKAPGQFAPPIVLPVFPIVRHAVLSGFRDDEITPRLFNARRMLPARIELDLRRIEARDVTKDGKPDLVCGDVYFAQKADGTLDTVPALLPGGPTQPTSREFLDLAGNGRLDRLVAENDLSDPFNIITRVRVFMADDQGHVPTTPTQSIVGQNILIFNDLPVQDFLKDGTLGFAMFKVDITPTDLALWVRLNLGKIEGDLNFYFLDKRKNRYSPGPDYHRKVKMTYKIDPAEAVAGVVWDRYLGTMMRFEGDYNADGRPDLLVREETNTICIYYNTGRRNALFPRNPDIRLEEAKSFSGLTVEDLNGDGASDLILYSYGGRIGFGPVTPQTGVVSIYISERR